MMYWAWRWCPFPWEDNLEMLNVLYLYMYFVAATLTLRSNSTALDGGNFTL